MSVLDHQEGTRRWSNVKVAVSVGIVARLVIFFGVMIIPIANEAGGRVSPLHIQNGTDFEFYLLTVQKYFLGDGDIIRDTLAFYDQFAPSAYFSPPLFPGIMYLSGYASGVSLFLATIYLALGIVLVAIWIPWLHRQGVGLGTLVLFALLPNSIWFMVSVSTDLLFSVIVAVFFVSYFERKPSTGRTIVWLTCLALAALTRTNSVSLIVFLFADIALDNLKRRRLVDYRLFAVAAVGLVALFFYLPSFGGFVATDGRIELFSKTVEEYQNGLFSALPTMLDKLFSWAALVGAKLLYLVGLRPSFSGTPLPLVLVRGAAGAIMLPGLLFLLIRGPKRVAVFVALFLLPFMFGPAQDRYVLPIQPILFFYGVKFYALLLPVPRWWKGLQSSATQGVLQRSSSVVGQTSHRPAGGHVDDDLAHR